MLLTAAERCTPSSLFYLASCLDITAVTNARVAVAVLVLTIKEPSEGILTASLYTNSPFRFELLTAAFRYKSRPFPVASRVVSVSSKQFAG